MNLLAIAAGGALGALFRYGLSGYLGSSGAIGLPWGTIGVNLAGFASTRALFGALR